jgi:predicted amino acid-binding ACT domain protein
MPVEMVLTIISKDRPGLVQTLAQVIADRSGNWIDSSMARLGGEFAGILRVNVSERTGSRRRPQSPKRQCAKRTPITIFGGSSNAQVRSPLTDSLLPPCRCRSR